ncbi:hypothetical protein BD770DRAFT_391973 [Pilaira anomala]|nr:hypothetical protein BD770DRAFT_391973 [Pilaira anomala]
MVKMICRSCSIPGRQLCVQSDMFQNSESSDLEGLFLEWDGIVHIASKTLESDCVFIHFSTNQLASECYRDRATATLGGEKVTIFPVSHRISSVFVAVRPKSEVPHTIPKPSIPVVSLRHSQHNRFNTMVKRNLDEIDDMVEIYENELKQLKKKRKAMQEFLDH